ncbi:hypothetical protein KK062_03900 [Fulvivirgaceae bacterium PWU5]|uniref:Uncharacterized protein n=1 Tax=Dawidia cretensis TaxID=2782350 RepID=A0AAP2DTV2_9BACT|nr:hypothetical protein [Dawidia cretensis]MBT1707348.1 hypothetical protein [Dawidia cretensis]
MHKIHLVKSLLISDFPSGSSINYYEGKFYLIGDDSRNVLVMNSDYAPLGAIHLFDYAEQRIAKREKVDLEGSAIVRVGDTDNLLIVGSGSRKNRKRIILIPLTQAGLEIGSMQHAIYKTKDFLKRIEAAGVAEINLEGVTLVHNNLVLGNRGNRSTQDNHLIVTDTNFWENQGNANLLIKRLIMPVNHTNVVLGVSELCYIRENDTLLISFTSENTDNAYDDGEIGDSYIAWISHASAQLHKNEIIVDELLNLSTIADAFKRQKVEGMCYQMSGADFMLHLVSDNDNGESRLFQILLNF